MEGFCYIPSIDSKEILGPYFKVIAGTEETTRNLRETYKSQRKPLSKLYWRED